MRHACVAAGVPLEWLMERFLMAAKCVPIVACWHIDACWHTHPGMMERLTHAAGRAKCRNINK